VVGKGLFLAIEGVDGSGKATQVAKLKEKLEQQGYQVRALYFHYRNQGTDAFIAWCIARRRIRILHLPSVS
jgi:thymidylate kinase